MAEYNYVEPDYDEDDYVVSTHAVFTDTKRPYAGERLPVQIAHLNIQNLQIDFTRVWTIFPEDLPKKTLLSLDMSSCINTELYDIVSSLHEFPLLESLTIKFDQATRGDRETRVALRKQEKEGIEVVDSDGFFEEFDLQLMATLPTRLQTVILDFATDNPEDTAKAQSFFHHHLPHITFEADKRQWIYRRSSATERKPTMKKIIFT